MATDDADEDETRIWHATRTGLARGSLEGHAAGLRRGLAIAEPIFVIGLTTIFVLWLAHVLLGADVRFEIGPLLAGGGGGTVVGGGIAYGIQALRARRSGEGE